MDKEKLAYIEEFGEFFEGFGVGRMLGRVLGVLLVPGPPERTAEELAGIVKARPGVYKRGDAEPGSVGRGRAAVAARGSEGVLPFDTRLDGVDVGPSLGLRGVSQTGGARTGVDGRRKPGVAARP